MAKLHAGVKASTLTPLRFSALLRQRPDAIAFLEAILGAQKPGLIKLHVRDGQILAWGFTPGGRRKES